MEQTSGLAEINCFDGLLSANSRHRGVSLGVNTYVFEYIGEAAMIIWWCGARQEFLKLDRVGIASIRPPYLLDTVTVIVHAN